MDYICLERALTYSLEEVCCIPVGELRTLIRDTIKLQIGVEYFHSQLETKIVHFQYRKVDGSTREAWGTLNPKFIQREWQGRGERKGNILDCIIYFDLEKMDWRTFKTENLIEVL